MQLRAPPHALGSRLWLSPVTCSTLYSRRDLEHVSSQKGVPAPRSPVLTTTLRRLARKWEQAPCSTGGMRGRRVRRCSY